ncbi:unnamed protein product [Linum trigynum]|uniref:Retrotransposon gag domain-containing protein n=1 Tax=Linum trigynum TaxID=586398 RepID=A0AAV2FWW4_9ROSI
MAVIEARLQAPQPQLQVEANPNPRVQREDRRENRAPPPLFHEVQRNQANRRVGLPRAVKRERRPLRNEGFEGFEEDEDEFGQEEEEDFRNLKISIPPFRGTINPDHWLDWERKVELIFDCHRYSEKKKVMLAALEFSEYALIWWDQLNTKRRRNRQRPIETWYEMRSIMRERFVPSYHQREMHQMLHPDFWVQVRL